MTSAIDATKPADGSPASKSDLRSSFSAAKSEIEDLQDKRARSQNIHMHDFGVRAGAADNSEALVALQTYLHQNRDTLVTVTSEPGLIDYDYNGWMHGVGRVVFNLYGSEFRCTHTGGQAYAQSPLTVAGFNHQDSRRAIHESDGLSSTANRDYGTTFTGSEVGALDITVADPAAFSADTEVFIFGFDRQPTGGTPRNPAFFEYAEVKSVAGNVVTLKWPLRHRYAASWQDVTTANGTTMGAARIVPVHHTNNYWPQYLELNGGDFLPNAINPAIEATSLTARHLIVRDTRSEVWYFSLCEKGYFERLRGENVEPDKWTEEMTFDDILVVGDVIATPNALLIGGATGCQRMTIRNSTIKGGFSNLTPLQRLDFDNCVFPVNQSGSGITVSVPGHSTPLVTAKNCTMFADAGWFGGFTYNNNGPSQLSAAVAGTTGNEVHLPYDPIDAGVVIRIGQVLWTSDGRGGAILAVDQNAGNLVVTLDTDDTFALGDVLQYASVEWIDDLGGNRIIGPTPDIPLIYNPFALKDKDHGKRRRAVRFATKNADVPNNNNARRIIRMTLEEIRIDVLRASPTALTLNLQWEGVATNEVTIDMSQAGERVITASTATGAAGADSIAPGQAQVGSYVDEVYIRNRNGANSDWSAIAAQDRPIYEVTLTGVQL